MEKMQKSGGKSFIVILLGLMFLFSGWVMKSQNAGDMINGFNDRRYSKIKVSTIM